MYSAALAAPDVAPSLSEAGGDPVLVTVYRGGNALEAHAVRARLEAEGLHAFVLDEHVNQLNRLYAVALKDVRVQVPQTQLPAAHAVLQALKAGEFSLDEGESAGPDPRPLWKKVFSVLFLGWASLTAFMMLVSLLEMLRD